MQKIKNTEEKDNKSELLSLRILAAVVVIGLFLIFGCLAWSAEQPSYFHKRHLSYGSGR